MNSTHKKRKKEGRKATLFFVGGSPYDPITKIYLKLFRSASSPVDASGSSGRVYPYNPIIGGAESWFCKKRMLYP
jgi:hypothetical protein